MGWRERHGLTNVARAIVPAPTSADDDRSAADGPAALDAERHTADQQAARGYDYDPSAPSHADFMERQRDRERQDLAEYRQRMAETEVRFDRLAAPPQSASQLRAKELMRTCLEHDVGLRIDPDGALVVVSNGHAWRALVNDIELHIDAIVALLIAGWDATDA